MKVFKRILIFTIVSLMVLIETSTLVAQERYSVVVGKVLGIRARKITRRGVPVAYTVTILKPK